MVQCSSLLLIQVRKEVLCVISGYRGAVNEIFAGILRSVDG